MNDEKLGRLYQEIVGIIIDTIPEEWLKVYLYAEVNDGSQTADFYYYPKDSDKPICCHDITELFTISEEEYSIQWHQLLDSIKELWREFIDNDEAPWTSFTLIFDNTGKFKIDFSYDDLSNADPHEIATIWRYENMGIVPKSNSGKKHLEKYLQTIKNKEN
ncbi:uncharacterized protein (TIGR01741 family) [Oikeobacillus pervagus]|uniref:Uncharacterized protein (TIGR01741 family) n=1 Tax=Oikeobacillus pervagus TaxID=1325931 RepID=A0AAJ1T373_9BACI|nr:antitoxin YezG family protein [Oikeobacillus pervagus]MDQ0215831.1 uncharacterized protein (TIGR01741 family) [Oikeobacillus pervagus]